MHPKQFYLILLLVLVPSMVRAYDMSDEFMINTYTPMAQNYSSSASNGSNYLVTWDSDSQDGASMGIFGQFLDKQGNAIDSEFIINTYTDYNESQPSVYSNGSNYLVTWHTQVYDGYGYGVYGQVIDSNGSPVGSEILINTTTSGHQNNPSVASDGNNYMVTWGDSNDKRVKGKIINSNGTPSGGEFNLGTIHTDYHTSHQAVFNGTNYLVTYSDQETGVGDTIYGRLFNTNGTPAGSDFQISEDGPGAKYGRSMAYDGTKTMLVYNLQIGDGDDYGVYGRFIANDGTLLGEEFLINQVTAGQQLSPEVAFDGEQFLVIWHDESGSDGDDRGIAGRFIDNDGTFLTDEFVVNNYTTSFQSYPSLTVNGDQFLATWSRYEQFGAGQSYDVVGRYITYASSNAVPEPATIILLCMGLLGVIKKRSKLK